ncbi:hypothetical protein, partial [Methanomethylovorans sp.]|uniref:hypothetical protein n=1 Tax=Methanomethylovorans sp. TaxID=2758717 RepID=UPI002FDD2D00
LKGISKDAIEATTQEVGTADNGTEYDKKENVIQCIMGLREEFIRLTKEKLGTEITDKYIEEIWSDILPYKK